MMTEIIIKVITFGPENGGRAEIARLFRVQNRRRYTKQNPNEYTGLAHYGTDDGKDGGKTSLLAAAEEGNTDVVWSLATCCSNGE